MKESPPEVEDKAAQEVAPESTPAARKILKPKLTRNGKKVVRQ
jgi:hypothetical protein